jgi:DnaK suppressor protein
LVDVARLGTPDDEHDPEGTTAYDRAQLASLLEENRVRLGDIERSLAAIQDAGFGACSRCGRAVGVERLLAVPGTTQCAGCVMKGR